MSDTNNRNSQDNGLVRGDDAAMPFRGTGIGFEGAPPELLGASTQRDATNRIVGIGRACKSDDAYCTMPNDPENV